MTEISLKIDHILGLGPIIPVLTVERRDLAVPLAKALLGADLKVLEVTLRTDAAMDVITDLADRVPEAIVGVGTVTSLDQLEEAEQRGAKFAVSPGLDTMLAHRSNEIGIPYLPGVVTPGEIMRAQTLGLNYLKFFPAETSGGVATLKQLFGPFPDIAFCPTGGLNASNFESYLAQPNVICVGGNWVAPPGAIANEKFDEIQKMAATSLQLCRSV